MTGDVQVGKARTVGQILKRLVAVGRLGFPLAAILVERCRAIHVCIILFILIERNVMLVEISS